MLSLNIVFPVLNEERRLEKGVITTINFMRDQFQCDYCITIVDNGSTDKTPKLCRNLALKYPEVRYIRTDEKGVGIAFQTAVEKNDKDIIGYMDIDLSTDIHHLSDMYEKFQNNNGIGIVNGSRWNKESVTTGRKWYRNVTSYGLVKFIRIMFHVKATDVICGFKFFRYEVIDRLVTETKKDNGWFYIIEMLIRAEKDGIEIFELPVRWIDDYDTTVHVKKLVQYYIKCSFELKRRLKGTKK